MKKITGEDVKQIRLKERMTQPQFLKIIGMNSQSWLSAIENGRVPVSGRVRIICELLRRKKFPVPSTEAA